MASLKSKLRRKLMESHGSRKNTRNAIWLAYSPKSKSDVALASNNECVYWLTHLETDPAIKSFHFGYEAELKFESEDGFRKREIIRVELQNGETQAHVLSAGDGGVVRNTVAIFALFPGKAVKEERQISHIRVHSDHLRQQAQKATRVLKMIGFASQIREHRHDVVTAAVELTLLALKAGRVEQLLLATSRHDPMVVLGVLAEKILAGGVEIDLETRALGNHSYWKLK
ncbi:hypothetical protein GIV49_19650 [Pseudomonas syringae]|uniref:hypothetical protein n=1 Tax=Pseudomonas syringae TaxID=317 RepID=UPI001F21994E|nr:hypothetical protein [Pseudomonas syringae]MCF5651758.1 hypothetical protein [Pseudomonas syringae]